MTELIQPSEVRYWIPSETDQNFGDYITEFFLDRMLLDPRIRASKYRLIGSVIDNLNIAADVEAVLDGGRVSYWGCGARDPAAIRPELLARCEFHGVRGPLTRDLLGLPQDTVLGDPGFLLPLIHPPAPTRRRHGKAICVPHFFEPRPDAELVAMTGADRVVRPAIASSLTALEAILDQITGASFVLAGAMHAAVVAHAYGIPFAYFDSGHVDIPFKWRDLSASIGIATSFVSTLADGRAAYDQFIAPKAKTLPLLPILQACPFHVRPSGILKAAAHDLNTRPSPALLEALRASGFEKRSYAAEAIESIGRRDKRILDHVSALEVTAAQASATSQALAEAEAERRRVEAALADRIVELTEIDARRVASEVDCGRLLARAESQATDLADLRAEASALAQELERAAATSAALEARGADLASSLAAARRESAALEEGLEAEQERGLAASVHFERELRRWAERLRDMEDLDSRLRDSQHALAQAVERSRGLALDARLGRMGAQRRGLGLVAASAGAHLLGARLAARRGAWAAAERAYAKILVRGDKDPRVLVQYGHALKEQGEMALAAEAYARAFQLPGAEFDVSDHLVHALRETGQQSAAARIEREAALHLAYPVNASAMRRHGSRGTPPLAWPRVIAASRAAKAKDWSRAVRNYQALVRRAPSSPRLWVQYGHALKEAGRRRHALRAYLTALDLDPFLSDTHLQLGHILKLLGMPVQSEQAYRRALELDGGSTEARRELATIAREALERAGSPAGEADSEPETASAQADRNTARAGLSPREERLWRDMESAARDMADA